MRDLMLTYGWLGLPLVAAALFVVYRARLSAKRERSARRHKRRIRSIAHQRAWDWLFGRSRHLRITHVPEQDADR